MRDEPLTAALPKRPIYLNEFLAGLRTSNAIMMLCTVRSPDDQPIIDFGSLVGKEEYLSSVIS